MLKIKLYQPLYPPPFQTNTDEFWITKKTHTHTLCSAELANNSQWHTHKQRLLYLLNPVGIIIISSIMDSEIDNSWDMAARAKEVKLHVVFPLWKCPSAAFIPVCTFSPDSTRSERVNSFTNKITYVSKRRDTNLKATLILSVTYLWVYSWSSSSGT